MRVSRGLGRLVLFPGFRNKTWSTRLGLGWVCGFPPLLRKDGAPRFIDIIRVDHPPSTGDYVCEVEMLAH